MPESKRPAGDAAPEDDDETLVRRAREGSRAACEALFVRHRGVAYRVAHRHLGNDQDAEDAVQDGLVKAFSALHDFDGRSGFRTWLVRIVSNAAIDLGRKRGRRQILGLGASAVLNNGAASPNGESNHHEPTTHDDPARGLHQEDLRKTLNAALDDLSPKYRETFILFAEAGLSYKEIAEALSVPIGTVMSRLNYARQRLKANPAIQSLEGLEPA